MKLKILLLFSFIVFGLPAESLATPYLASDVALLKGAFRTLFEPLYVAANIPDAILAGIIEDFRTKIDENEFVNNFEAQPESLKTAFMIGDMIGRNMTIFAVVMLLIKLAKHANIEQINKLGEWLQSDGNVIFHILGSLFILSSVAKDLLKTITMTKDAFNQELVGFTELFHRLLNGFIYTPVHYLVHPILDMLKVITSLPANASEAIIPEANKLESWDNVFFFVGYLLTHVLIARMVFKQFLNDGALKSKVLKMLYLTIPITGVTVQASQLMSKIGGPTLEDDTGNEQP